MTLGVDVAKDNLVISDLAGKLRTIHNNLDSVTALLGSLDPGDTIAMEATSHYHKLLADMAYSQGFKVIVFNPKDVLHYARSISPRAKTDRVDSTVIARYASVRGDHKLYEPTPEIVKRLKNLVSTRRSLVDSKTSFKNKLADCPESEVYLKPVIDGISDQIAKLDRELNSVVSALQEHARMVQVPGVATLVGAYALCLLESGSFVTSDSFVAFVGLDIKVRQSGKKTGRACISKRGDPEARRLLFLAARAAARTSGPFQELYQRHQLNGLSKTAATVAVARKLARTLWAIHTKQQQYRPERVLKQRLALDN